MILKDLKNSGLEFVCLKILKIGGNRQQAAPVNTAPGFGKILLLTQKNGKGKELKNLMQSRAGLKTQYLKLKTVFQIMFKKLVSIALFAFAFNGFVSAQRIAYVDVTAVLESLPEYQKAQEQLDKLATTWRQEIAQEQDKIKGMYSKYQAEQVLLSEEMKRTREEEITNKEKEVREMQRQKFGPEGALFKKREELVKPIQDKVYAAIQKLAEDKGFDFIFDKGSASGMLFADPRYDKTEDVKKILK